MRDGDESRLRRDGRLEGREGPGVVTVRPGVDDVDVA
jgi:hypothetical protein